jgi:hypothetical protein
MPTPFPDLLSSAISSFVDTGMQGVLIAVCLMCIMGLIMNSFFKKGG